MNRLIGILLWTFEQTILGHDSELLVPAMAIPLAAEFVNKMTEMKFIRDDRPGFPHQNPGRMAGVVAHPLQAILLSIMIAYSEDGTLLEANDYSIAMDFGPLEAAACNGKRGSPCERPHPLPSAAAASALRIVVQ